MKSLTQEQVDEFKAISEKMIEWLNKNTDPHHKAIIETNRAELVSGRMAFSTNEYIAD